MVLAGEVNAVDDHCGTPWAISEVVYRAAVMAMLLIG